MTSKTTPALSKPNFTSTPRTLPPYKPCPYRPHIYNSFIPTAALPMVRLEENICPTHCTHTAHRAFRILAPFSSQPSLLLSFPFACLTPAQHKKVHKGCLPDWSVQQSPSSLLCETANTSSKDLRRNKALHHCFNLNYLKCCFFFIIYLSCCSLLSQVASSYLLQSLTYTQASFEQNKFSCLDAYIHEI